MPCPLRCNPPLLIQSESKSSLEINSEPLELQKVRTELLTLITLRLSWSPSFLRIRLDTVTLVQGVSRSIAFPRSTIFSAICCGSSFRTLLVPTCKIISSGLRRAKGFEKSSMSSTVLPLKDSETTWSPLDNFFPCMLLVIESPKIITDFFDGVILVFSVFDDLRFSLIG